MNYLEFLNTPEPVPNRMPPMTAPAGASALDAYRAAIGGTSTGTPETVRAAATWHAGIAAVAAGEAAQLSEFLAASAQRQPAADDGATVFPQTRAFSADPDAQMLALKSAAEAQRLAGAEVARAEEAAERKRRFDEWTPDANVPRAHAAA